MPLPSTCVIPDDWSKHHAPVAEDAMNATVTITIPDAVTVYDPDTDDTTQDSVVLYEGRARIQSLIAGRNASRLEQAGDLLTASSWLVQLEYEAATPPPGSRVTVNTCLNDADLVNQTLWTIASPGVSERFTRDVWASAAQPESAHT